MTEAAETVLEVFIPGPGENPEDSQDMERSEFLGAAQEALDSGVDIEVYSTDSYRPHLKSAHRWRSRLR